jgi:hypothetical protein
MLSKEFDSLIDTWTNIDKAKAIKKLKASMAESITNRVPDLTITNYVKSAIKEGLVDGTIQDYPGDFSNSARSLFYKEGIQKVIREMKKELSIDESNKPLKQAWSNCEKSKTLVEFRSNFKMYLTILHSELYSLEDIQIYVVMIDELEGQVKELMEYKRQCNEMYNVMSRDDESLTLLLRANSLKEVGLGDTDIATILGTTKDNLKYLRKKITLE